MLGVEHEQLVAHRCYQRADRRAENVDEQEAAKATREFAGDDRRTERAIGPAS
jgi:hypothetical protein